LLLIQLIHQEAVSLEMKGSWCLWLVGVRRDC